MFLDIGRKAIVFGFVLASGVATTVANDAAGSKTRGDKQIGIKAIPWGPSQTDIDRAKERVTNSAEIRRVLGNTKNRLVGFEYIDNYDPKEKRSKPPSRFRVIFYDYSNDRTFIAQSDFAGREAITVEEAAFDPGVDRDEMKAASNLVRQDSEFAALSASRSLEIYDPMPPVSNLNGERLVNIGVRNLNTGQNQIVGVSFKNSRVVRYGSSAPPSSKASPESCGIQDSGQASTPRGTAGQYMLTTTQPGQSTPIWEMLVTRPSVSSGSQGSGIDLQDIKYRGKSVLKRAHAPVLNVKYVAGSPCGPYLDWQYEEGPFSVPDTGVTYPNGATGGIAILSEGQVATTALDTANDSGNFRGIAIYRQGRETVMVTEMNAGWYRYLMEWRFDDDGTIRPRYGFGATLNSCVCSVHYHHIFWRFDFDIVTANNKVFQVERGRKFLKPVATESAIFRNYATNRGLVIQNGSGDEAYMLVPNLTDGFWDRGDPVYGAGDFWVLKTAPANSELGTIAGTMLNMAPYLNGESVNNTDVTVWYGAHFAHENDQNRLNPDRSPEILTGEHVVGPDIRPIRW